MYKLFSSLAEVLYLIFVAMAATIAALKATPPSSPRTALQARRVARCLRRRITRRARRIARRRRRRRRFRPTPCPPPRPLVLLVSAMERALIVALLLAGGVEPNPGPLALLLTSSIPEGTWIEAALEVDGSATFFCGRVNSPPGETREIGFEYVSSDRKAWARIRDDGDQGRGRMVVVKKSFPPEPSDALLWRAVVTRDGPPGLSQQSQKVKVAAKARPKSGVDCLALSAAPAPVAPVARPAQRAEWTHEAPSEHGALDAVPVATYDKVPAQSVTAFRNALLVIFRRRQDPLHNEVATHEVLSFVKNHLRKMMGGSKRQRERHLREQLVGKVCKQHTDTLQETDADLRAARRASRLARLGNLGRAARTLMQRAATFTGDVIATLKAMHPAEPPLSAMEELIANLRGNVKHPNVVTVEEALDAAQSLCSGAAPGPTGWTEELILQLLQDETLAPYVAALLSDIANNDIPPSVSRRLTRCRLLDLPKSSTAIRPIAIGEALLKVASCAMFAKHVGDVAAIFKGLQFGVGVRGGAEVIVHQVRGAFAQASTASGVAKAVCTLDAKNAFNSVSRLAIAQALLQHPQLAQLTPLFLLEYESHTDLLHKEGTVPSRTGVRQGSVLGPLWFSLAIHASVAQAMADQPKEKVACFLYMDDATIVGEPSYVATAAKKIEEALRPLGLIINRSKSEWIASDGTAAPKEFATPDAIKVLGAFIGPDEACRRKLKERLDDQRLFFERLSLMDPDVAAAVLSVAGVPRAGYIARTHAPDVSVAFTLPFDGYVELAWCKMADVNPDTASEVSKDLAHLPASLGGLGFTRATRIAPDAYTASTDFAFGISNVSQRDRSTAANLKTVEKLRTDKAVATHLESVKEAGNLLRHPSERPVDSGSFRAFLRLLLRAAHFSLPDRLDCPGCRHTLTSVEFGPHVAGCTRVSGFNPSSRHAGAKKCIDHVMRLCGISTDTTEPREVRTATCPGCHKRVDEANSATHLATCTSVSAEQRRKGATMRSSGPDGRVYFEDTQVVYDFTTVSPTAPSFAQKGHTAAMDARVTEKRRLYAARVIAGGEEFVVAGATVFGALGRDLKQLLIRAANASAYDVDIDALLRFVALYVATASGRVIASAERKAGVIHQRAQLTAAPAQPTQARAPTPAAATTAALSAAPPATPASALRPPQSLEYESLTASRAQTPTAEREPVSRPTSVPPASTPVPDPQGRATGVDRPSSRPISAFGQATPFSFAGPNSSTATPTSAFGQSAFQHQQGRPSSTVSAGSGPRFGFAQ
jgi:hypothetical protein